MHSDLFAPSFLLQPTTQQYLPPGLLSSSSEFLYLGRTVGISSPSRALYRVAHQDCMPESK